MIEVIIRDKVAMMMQIDQDHPEAVIGGDVIVAVVMALNVVEALTGVEDPPQA